MTARSPEFRVEIDSLRPSALGMQFVREAPPHAQRRHERIAEMAYFKAEHRGFAPGHELDDWLEAETEIGDSP